MNKTRIIKTLAELNSFNAANVGISRLAYTEEERKARRYFQAECERLGMTVRIDQAGNMIARRDGINNSLPAVAIGSHLDTVYNGGKYDGILGVVAGLEVVRELAEEGIETEHPIEIIVFACEESSRFNFSTLGSKAMTGCLKKEAVRHLVDRDGMSVTEAFLENGLDFEAVTLAERAKDDIKVFFELHIEQGTCLIDCEKTIGLVTGIAAPLRLAINIKGESAHSGTARMINRKDAFLAAAELALAVEKAALAEADFDTVATVGVVEVPNGAMNVVPGEVKLKVDIRSLHDQSRQRVLEAIEQTMSQIEACRKVAFQIDWKSEEEPIFMSKEMGSQLASICESLQIPYMSMPSGAGHDSMNMAKKWETALIFVPSVAGISHHPDEFTNEDDIAAGIHVLKEAVMAYANAAAGKERDIDEVTSSKNTR